MGFCALRSEQRTLFEFTASRIKTVGELNGVIVHLKRHFPSYQYVVSAEPALQA